MGIDVLGTEYVVVETDQTKDPRLSNCDGFCDKTSKKIVITKKPEDSDLDNWKWYRDKILRHEIIHAFFTESGLQENFESKPYGVSETLVDWFAIQYQKIKKVFDELNI